MLLWPRLNKKVIYYSVRESNIFPTHCSQSTYSKCGLTLPNTTGILVCVDNAYACCEHHINEEGTCMRKEAWSTFNSHLFCTTLNHQNTQKRHWTGTKAQCVKVRLNRTHPIKRKTDQKHVKECIIQISNEIWSMKPHLTFFCT